ncbi:hypothetical protein CPHO_07380 [Corynebacterium phocae]|uniref:Uncharacterized protein n=2 Tax=Corynebacterium phocae TaxID=161895 RepID=A0A1L7D6N8_9CORY|nr:hypothetical protein CPHO_07380 [Corynebacterium phocae]
MVIMAASLMLFSMFFGAGNLIFPPMVGVNSGTNFWPAIIGFLAAGVVLPIVSIIAVAMGGSNVRELAARGGWLFGLGFSVIAYLSIGAFYALPRTGAVAMSTAITPLTEWDGIVANSIFALIFFGVTLLLAWNPHKIIDTLGKVLTPALVFLLLALIAVAAVKFERHPEAPVAAYQDNPMVAGLFEGYNTMDAIAGLAFGIVIISSLRAKGLGQAGGQSLVRLTSITGVIAGSLLAVIYLGLAYIAQTIPDSQSYTSGAELLADSSNLTLGIVGQLAFSLIVLLACLTTSVGLLSATSEFFHRLAPGLSYHGFAIIFTVMSAALAIQGLDTVLAIAVPFIIFLYPPAITLMLVTMLQPLLKSVVHFHWTYRVALWVAAIWSALSVLASQGIATEALRPMLGLAPGFEVGLDWVAPTAVALVVGFVLDLLTQKKGIEQ